MHIDSRVCVVHARPIASHDTLLLLPGFSFSHHSFTVLDMFPSIVEYCAAKIHNRILSTFLQLKQKLIDYLTVKF